jgi:hypothetical protein
MRRYFIFNQDKNNNQNDQKIQLLITAINEIYDYTQMQKKIWRKNIVCIHFHSGAGGARVNVAAKEGAEWNMKVRVSA